MKRSTLTDLGRDLVFFFDDFLPNQRGLSAHTIRSYRDTLVLLLHSEALIAEPPWGGATTYYLL